MSERRKGREKDFWEGTNKEVFCPEPGRRPGKGKTPKMMRLVCLITPKSKHDNYPFAAELVFALCAWKGKALDSRLDLVFYHEFGEPFWNRAPRFDAGTSASED